MHEILTVNNERVDDMPLWQAHVQRMGLPALLDEPFPPHGNWQGLSLGGGAGIWLPHLLSAGAPRLHHVEPGVQNRLWTLRRSTGQPVQALAGTDDRLEAGLLALRDDVRWEACESALHRQGRRVYEGPPARGHVESPRASGSWPVTEDGVCQCGHRKEHRPDLPHGKVMQAVLAPLGRPLATAVVAGECADAPW